MPPPIWPAPTTRTCSRSIRGGYRRAMSTAEVNGARLWFEESGEGPAVLLLHGGLGDARPWDPQFRPLAERFRTIRFAQRFFGRSTGPAAPFSYVNDVIGLLDEL